MITDVIHKHRKPTSDDPIDGILGNGFKSSYRLWPHQSRAYNLTNLRRDGVVLAKPPAMAVDWVQQLGRATPTASATQG